MHAEEEPRPGPDRALVVAQARLVRGPDLAQHRARAFQDLRDTEAPPDLHQLPPRDDRLLPEGEGVQGEEHRGRVVVHDQRRLGAQEPGQDRLHVRHPRPARSPLQVQLQIRVAARGLDDRGDRLLREHGPPQVGVDHDAGGVDHGPGRRKELRFHPPGRVPHDRLARGGLLPRSAPRAERNARGGDGLPCRLREDLVGRALPIRGELRRFEQGANRG